MNNKERIKLKQQAKKKAKQEVERIIDKYMSQIDDVLNEQFNKIDSVFDETIQNINDGYVLYQSLLAEIMLILKDGTDLDLQNFSKKLKQASDFENQLEKEISERNLQDKDTIIEMAKATSNMMVDVIEKAYVSLNGNKNQYYITSLLYSRCKKLTSDYILYSGEKIDAINDYIDMYETAKDEFVDYLKNFKENIEIKNIDEDINNLEKHNGRLRVEYYQLEKFLNHKGYEFERQKSSTHAIWKNTVTGKSVPLPHKSKTVPQGTVSSVLRKINSNRQELINFLNN